MRHTRATPVSVTIQHLEPRRMLSFVPGPELTVTGGAESGGFDVAVAGDGSYLIAADVARGDVHRVMAFRYSAAGERLGEPITLYSYVPPLSPFRRTARIAASMDADGDAVVAYSVFDGGDSGVYVSRIDRIGAVAGSTVRVGDVDEDHTPPSVSMDSSGGFFVAWRDPESYNGFQARAYDASGVPRAAQFQLRALPGIGNLTNVQIAAKADGTSAVFAAGVINSADFGPDNFTVAFGRTSTSGLFVAPGEITGSFDRVAPVVAASGDGSFVVGYVRVDKANPVIRAVYVQRFTSAGAASGDPIQLGGSLPSEGNATHSLSLDDAPGGGFVASFVQTTGSVDTIYAARFDAAGALDESGYVQLATGPSSGEFGDGRFHPKVGADARGSAVVGYVTRIGQEVRYRRLASGNVDAVLRGSELFVNGTEGNDHIIVETVRQNLFINVNGVVQRFNASAVQFLSISGLGGDDDIVNATALPATIHGGDGADTVWGGVGPDRIRGFGGNDSLRGGDGDDAIFGDNGDDTLHGGDGTDTLTGAAGIDALLAGEVVDRLIPGVSIDRRGYVLITGTHGNDTLLAWRSGRGLVVSVNGLTTAFPFADVRYINMLGLNGDDRLELEASLPVPSTMRGGPHHDVLRGGAREDFLVGDGGNDTLGGGLGRDVVEGNAGDNWILGELDGDVFQSDVDSVDTVDYSSHTIPLVINILVGFAFAEGFQGATFASNFKRIVGGAGADRIVTIPGSTVWGGDGGDTIRGGQGNDELYGEAGNDDIDGDAGADFLDGGGGDDTLRSTDGALIDNGFDSLFGSAGNDTFLTDDGAADRIRGGLGNDGADADQADDVLEVEAVS